MVVADLNGSSDDINGNGNGNGQQFRLVFDRKDVLKLIGLVLGVVTAAAGAIIPLMGYIFQTRYKALQEHAAIELSIALNEQRGKRVDDALVDAKKILRTLDINQRVLMRDNEIPKWRIEKLPEDIDFGDLEME